MSPLHYTICLAVIGFSLIGGPVLLGGLVWGDAGQPSQHRAQVQASGVVTKVTPTAITLKTPFAAITLNVKATERAGFRHVNVGDELTVWMNEHNVVMDLHKKGDQLQHRLICGKLAYSDRAKTEITLWTPEGTETFPLKTGEAPFQTLPEGTPVTIEIDELGRLMDIHKN